MNLPITRREDNTGVPLFRHLLYPNFIKQCSVETFSRTVFQSLFLPLQIFPTSMHRHSGAFMYVYFIMKFTLNKSCYKVHLMYISSNFTGIAKSNLIDEYHTTSDNVCHFAINMP
uniref:Uncharacterized protein n=1 Tax=Megaselia scalaris TaxID=36166 RepID=T1H1S4_MEGSC